MFQFVYWLKTFAAIFITNAHYADIWPVSSLAIGGHLGNCIYFFVSGFCLYNIKESFPKWYAKRIIRIYPALWIAATVDFIVGKNSADNLMALIHCYIYPTWYHFIGSIMLLYIVFYTIRFICNKLKIDIRWFILIIFLGFVILYLLFFDKSSYHIDDINEKWVRFQFLESMLLGAFLREKYDAIKEKISCFNIISLLALMVCYFVAKKVISSYESLSVIQCFLPMILLCFVASLAVMCIKLEKKGFFASFNKTVNKLVMFLSGITLEIYLVQYLVIMKFSEIFFPLNFVLVTSIIIIYAWVLHKCSCYIQKKCSKLLRL